MRVAFVLLLAITTTTVQGQGDCYKYHSCTECVVQPHCGWCPTAAACWSGDAKGPENPAQHCDTDYWNFDKCTALRLQDGQRVSVKDPKGGFYDYYDFSLLYQGQDVTVVVDNGAATSNRKLFASQTVPLPRSNSYEWEGKTKGSLLELRLTASDLDYSKPLFLSVLNDVSLSYSIVAQMVPPSSGGELMSCSFSVYNTSFSTALSIKATSAVSDVCSKTTRSGDAFMQRLINDIKPLSDYEMVAVVVIEIYKGLLKRMENMTAGKDSDYEFLTLTAPSPYPYQGPKVLMLWRRLSHRSKVVPPQPSQPLVQRRSNCGSSPGWVVKGKSSSIDEPTQFWITSVYNEYLCGSLPESWKWEEVRKLGVKELYWIEWNPFQTQAGFRFEINGAVAQDSANVHWIWVSQSAVPSNGKPYLFVVLESVPIIPGNAIA
eukprot:m.340156 g.340156  ORF g.340156 m.340156 type:complete len:432 (+) comp19163_c0_seq1:147-1442(+)